MELILNNISELSVVAKELIKNFANNTVIAFYGSMGVGKTTLIKEICYQLGVKDMVNSPSFAIINEYETSLGVPIYHFDFYRLKNIDEAYNIGVVDYLYSGNLCFLEWAEKIENILPDDILKINIEVVDKKRIINISKN